MGEGGIAVPGVYARPAPRVEAGYESTPRPVALGSTVLQDPGAGRRRDRRRQGGSGGCARQACEAARRRRPAADPAWSLRICRGGARPVGTPRLPGGGGRALRGGPRGEARTGTPRRTAARSPVAPLRRKGPADEART